MKCDVLIVGGGIAGMSAGIFTARASCTTIIVNHGTSILRRNAHLENFPGFPMGIDPRLLLTMIRSQARWNGCQFRRGKVRSVESTEGGFKTEVRGKPIRSNRLIAASWKDADYLKRLPVDIEEDGSKSYVSKDRNGRTDVDGLYTAGRISGEYHQAIVSAGDGARTGLSVVYDERPDFYRDWTVPEGYFTGRDRNVPEGCEEISDDERIRRANRAISELRDYLKEYQPETPTPHPSQTSE